MEISGFEEAKSAGIVSRQNQVHDTPGYVSILKMLGNHNSLNRASQTWGLRYDENKPLSTTQKDMSHPVGMVVIVQRCGIGICSVVRFIEIYKVCFDIYIIL